VESSVRTNSATQPARRGWYTLSRPAFAIKGDTPLVYCRVIAAPSIGFNSQPFPASLIFSFLIPAASTQDEVVGGPSAF